MRKFSCFRFALEIFPILIFSCFTLTGMADELQTGGSAVPSSADSSSSAVQTGSVPPVQMISVPAEEWQKLQTDLTDIKEKMAANEEKARRKEEKEAADKYKKASFQVRTRIIWDCCSSSLDESAETAYGSDGVTGTKLRQGWIDVLGSVNEFVNYRLTYDASNDTIKDAWIGFFNLPCPMDIKVGHIKEPWSGEELTAVPAVPVMEKSYLNDLRGIHGHRNNGILFSNWSVADRWTWAAGVFAASMTDSSLNCFGENGHYAFTARTTWLPFYEENEIGQKFLLHFGASYSYRQFDQEKAETYATKCTFVSNSQISPSALFTGTLDGLESLNVYSLEAYWIRGPFALTFEQAFACMEDDRAGDALLTVGYVMATYSLTGESRNYRKAGGSFGMLKPNNPFIRTKKDGVCVASGPGAWELAYMCTWIDAGDLVRGYACEANHVGLLGQSVMHTWGINWYLNDYCRISFNYSLVHSDYEGLNTKGIDISGTDGTMHVFATRFQFTF